MRDVCDGRMYQQHFSSFTSEGNVTLMVNTDGMQLFKSSSVAMWPIWATINELPVKMRYSCFTFLGLAKIIFYRFSKKNMILSGLWCSGEKPNMNMFLKPLVTSANELYTNGNKDGYLTTLIDYKLSRSIIQYVTTSSTID